MIRKKKLPKIEYEKVPVEDSYYTRDEEQWDAKSLIDWCKTNKYPIFEIPLAALNLNRIPFALNHIDDFVFQMKRVNETDLKHPIILDDLGQIADGNHRICKALLEGKTTIKAIRIIQMPVADRIIKEDK